MTADAVSQIDPFASAAGVIPLVIAQELFNDIRVNSISAAQAVTNMATYCNARRAADSKLACATLAIWSRLVDSRLGWLPQSMPRLASRWWSFADFLVDMYAAGELKTAQTSRITKLTRSTAQMLDMQ